MDLIGLVVIKAFVYFAIVAVGGFRWGATTKHTWLRVFLASAARGALGWVVCIPAGFILGSIFGHDVALGFYVAFFALRFVLWLVTLRVPFMKAPIREVIALAALGTLINALLDLALPDSLIESFRINFC